MPRPVPSFHKFVGHKKITDLLKRQITGAQAHGQPFPHSMFTGPSGVGKTLLAEAIAAEFMTTIIMTSGYISQAELTDRLVALGTNDSLFIDESHAMKTPVQELLLGAIDDLVVPVVKGSTAPSAPQQEGSETVAIKPFTIFLATDQPGAIRNALQERMRLKVAISYYSIEELKEIVERMATDLNLLLSPQAARMIAQVSAGLPRRTKHYLENLRNHFPDLEKAQISLSLVREFLKDFDIDEKGLGAEDGQYLNYLKEVGPASLESLAICLGLGCDFVRRQVEPLLLQERLVKIGSGGRQLTAKGLDWIRTRETNNNSQDTDENGQN